MALYNSNSPYLIILIESFLPVDSDIIEIILKNEYQFIKDNKPQRLKRFYYQTIGYIFLLFGALILNEIIIFNRWGLNRFTVANIKIRAESDANDYSVLELTNTTNYGDDTDD